MTTSELIDQLRKADPTGNMHVRINGSTPYCCEAKEGYWDGHYTYFENPDNVWQSKLIYSTLGNKVDIHTMDLYDFISCRYYHGVTWETVQSWLKFEFTYYPESNTERIDSILKLAKQHFDEIDNMMQKFRQDSLNEMIANAKKGWRWFRNNDLTVKINCWLVLDENGNDQGSSVHNTESVIGSGLWMPFSCDRIGYTEWKYVGEII